MSHRSGSRSDTNEDAFPFWDEPERRRRRGKKNHESYRKTEDGGRARRPDPGDDDWEEDIEESDWRLIELEELDDDGELGGGAAWDEVAGWDDGEDEGEEDFD